MSRSLRQVVLGVFVGLACGAAASAQPVFQDGFESGGTCAWGIGSASCPGFEIRSPEITLAAGEESNYCYYFHAPVTGTVGIRTWLSAMDAVAHDISFYATYNSSWVPTDREPPGTLSQTGCGIANEIGTPTTAAWLYGAHHATEELALPTDDGSGTPLAVEILAGQPVFLEMHFINSSAQPVATTVWLGAEAHDSGVAYTKTATYLTYNASFIIPPQATGYVTSYTCATPPAVQFWWLSTRTFQHGLEAAILDGATTLVDSTDWQDPAAALFPAPPFFTFASGGLTYTCAFANPTSVSITAGNSRIVDENCVGLAYFFPATRPTYCVNNVGPL